MTRYWGFYAKAARGKRRKVLPLPGPSAEA
jgi:hypothetical protein